MYGEAMRMDLSVGSAFIMAVVIVLALAAFLAIVLFAGRRPYFKKRPGRPRTPVSGGVHALAEHRTEVEADARRIADELGKQLGRFFVRHGWITAREAR